ncbi:MAG: hypothetical protein U5K76_11760 [Woeseiaceae bacterium]|nr:hypothetical protein [Woeseiaceae bacterium]
MSATGISKGGTSGDIERTRPDTGALEDIVRFVLAEAKAAGVDQAEAAASHDVGLSATARLGDIENLEYTNDRGVGITVYARASAARAARVLPTFRSPHCVRPWPRHVRSRPVRRQIRTRVSPMLR